VLTAGCGPLPPWARTRACPQLAKADVASAVHPLFDPFRGRGGCPVPLSPGVRSRRRSPGGSQLAAPRPKACPGDRNGQRPARLLQRRRRASEPRWRVSGASPFQDLRAAALAVACPTGTRATIRYFLFRAYVPNITGQEPKKWASVAESSVVLPPATRSAQMLSSNLTHASSRAVTRPPCPKCGTTMVLARVDPHTTGGDIRTFECPDCDHSEGAVVHFQSPP
jgi:hypothetical protein